jgi:hypothetical protein
VVETLKIPGLVMDAADGNGRTAFQLVCLGGQLQIAKVLRKAGAATGRQDHDGASAFMMACHEGKMSVIIKDKYIRRAELEQQCGQPARRRSLGLRFGLRRSRGLGLGGVTALALLLRALTGPSSRRTMT